jgi:hypothetical protein
MEEPQFPTKDLSNKTVVGIALIMFGIILIIHFTERRKSPDYEAIKYLSHTADSLAGASKEKDKLIVELQKKAAHLIDTVTIIEKKQTIRYDNYIQTTASLRPDSTIDTSFAAARARFRERWESGVFFER